MSFLLRVSHGSCQTAGWCVLICTWDPASGSFRLLPVAGGWRSLCVGRELGLLSAARGHRTPSLARLPTQPAHQQSRQWRLSLGLNPFLRNLFASKHLVLLKAQLIRPGTPKIITRSTNFRPQLYHKIKILSQQHLDKWLSE